MRYALDFTEQGAAITLASSGYPEIRSAPEDEILGQIGSKEKEHAAMTGLFEGEFEKQAASTPDGMAYFKGTGPSGAKCGGCLHFKSEGNYAQSGAFGGRPKPSPCGKYKQMSGRKGGKIPSLTAACKYFDVKT